MAELTLARAAAMAGPLVVAVCQQKGGVGKTATSYNLARAGVRAGLRVLAVDIDPQGSLTYALADPPLEGDELTLADALSTHGGEVALSEVLTPGLWGTQLVPARQSLALVRDELVLAGVGRDARLKRALADVRGQFDLVVLDCPPDLSQLTVNALVAADVALPVTQPSQLSLNGLNDLLATIEEVRQHLHPGLRQAGVLVNQMGRLVLDREAMEELEASGLELSGTIPMAKAVRTAQESSLALDEVPGGYPIAETYIRVLQTLTKENA